MGTLRKYLFSPVIVSALISSIGAVRQQRKAPADWRTVLTWASWILSFMVAVGTVRIESQQVEDPEAKKGPKPATGPKPIKRARTKA
jgi:hypothetical protein